MTAIDELWRQVAAAPDDLAPRLVLADALVEAGDARGELIQLQCQGASDYRTQEAASELVVGGWDRWLGDLAAIIDRQGTAFADGMLHTVQFRPRGGLPDDRWRSALAHRELHAVKRARIAYGWGFGSGLEELLAAFPASCPQLADVTIRLRWAAHDEVDRFVDAIERLSREMPQLRAIEIHGWHAFTADPRAEPIERLRAIPHVSLP